MVINNERLPLIWFVSWCCDKHHQPKATGCRKALIWLQPNIREIQGGNSWKKAYWFVLSDLLSYPFRHSQGSLPIVDWVILRQLGQSVLDNSSINAPFLFWWFWVVSIVSTGSISRNIVNTRTHSGPVPKILKAQSKCTINTCQVNKWTNELMLLYRQRV